MNEIMLELIRVGVRPDTPGISAKIIGIALEDETAARGEQPNNPAQPVDGAMSGDIPRSWADKEIK